MRIVFEPGEETHEVRSFIELVWPPSSNADSPVGHIVHEHNYDRRILTRGDNGSIMSQVALVFRDASWNGETVHVGGIAGVGTDPAFRKQGLAVRGMRLAADFLFQHNFDFGVLFCAPTMIPFYERLGWRQFDGDVFITQPGIGRVQYGYCLTLDIKRSPRGGVLDLRGLPW